MTHETRDRARPLDAGFFMRVKAYYITGWDITEWSPFMMFVTVGSCCGKGIVAPMRGRICRGLQLVVRGRKFYKGSWRFC